MGLSRKLESRTIGSAEARIMPITNGAKYKSRSRNEIQVQRGRKMKGKH